MARVIGHDDNGGMSFMTANGVTQIQEVMRPRELNHKACVLGETPAVLSVTRKCMEQGNPFFFFF